MCPTPCWCLMTPPSIYDVRQGITWDLTATHHALLGTVLTWVLGEGILLEMESCITFHCVGPRKLEEIYLAYHTSFHLRLVGYPITCRWVTGAVLCGWCCGGGYGMSDPMVTHRTRIGEPCWHEYYGSMLSLFRDFGVWEHALRIRGGSGGLLPAPHLNDWGSCVVPRGSSCAAPQFLWAS